MAKPKKRRLLIDVIVPDRKGGYRMTIKGTSDTVKDDVLDAWCLVCGEILKIAAQGIRKDGL